MGMLDALRGYSSGNRDLAGGGNRAANAEAQLLQEQQQLQQQKQVADQLGAQKAYQEQQAIENSPEFLQNTLEYYKKNPNTIQYEEDPRILNLLQQNGLMKKPTNMFGF